MDMISKHGNSISAPEQQPCNLLAIPRQLQEYHSWILASESLKASTKSSISKPPSTAPGSSSWGLELMDVEDWCLLGISALLSLQKTGDRKK